MGTSYAYTGSSPVISAKQNEDTTVEVYLPPCDLIDNRIFGFLPFNTMNDQQSSFTATFQKSKNRTISTRALCSFDKKTVPFNPANYTGNLPPNLQSKLSRTGNTQFVTVYNVETMTETFYPINSSHITNTGITINSQTGYRLVKANILDVLGLDYTTCLNFVTGSGQDLIRLVSDEQSPSTHTNFPIAIHLATSPYQYYLTDYNLYSFQQRGLFNGVVLKLPDDTFLLSDTATAACTKIKNYLTTKINNLKNITIPSLFQVKADGTSYNNIGIAADVNYNNPPSLPILASSFDISVQHLYNNFLFMQKFSSTNKTYLIRKYSGAANGYGGETVNNYTSYMSDLYNSISNPGDNLGLNYYYTNVLSVSSAYQLPINPGPNNSNSYYYFQIPMGIYPSMLLDNAINLSNKHNFNNILGDDFKSLPITLSAQDLSEAGYNTLTLLETITTVNNVPTNVTDTEIVVFSSPSGSLPGSGGVDPAVSAALLNNTEIDPATNTYKIMDTDGTTVLKEYDLFDSTGAPTASNIYKRVLKP
jgi:hypothetical protein